MINNYSFSQINGETVRLEDQEIPLSEIEQRYALLENAKDFLRAYATLTHDAYHRTDAKFEDCPFTECGQVRLAISSWNRGQVMPVMVR